MQIERPVRGDQADPGRRSVPPIPGRRFQCPRLGGAWAPQAGPVSLGGADWPTGSCAVIAGRGWVGYAAVGPRALSHAAPSLRPAVGDS